MSPSAAGQQEAAGPAAYSNGKMLVTDAFAAARGRRKPALADMRAQVRDEAARIETVQAALIDAGMRSGPSDGQINKLVVWDALEQLVELFMRHESRARTFFRDLETQANQGDL